MISFRCFAFVIRKKKRREERIQLLISRQSCWRRDLKLYRISPNSPLSPCVFRSMKMQLRWLWKEIRDFGQRDHYCLVYACMFWFLWSPRRSKEAQRAAAKTMGIHKKWYKVESSFIRRAASSVEFIERLRSLRRVLKWNIDKLANARLIFFRADSLARRRWSWTQPSSWSAHKNER